MLWFAIEEAFPCCKVMENPSGKSRAVSPASGPVWLPTADAPCGKAAVLVQTIAAGALYTNPLASLGSSMAETLLL